MTEPVTDPMWSWPEDRWRGVLERVRAGRTLKPRKWKGGARAAVALSVNFGGEITALAQSGADPAGLVEGHYAARTGLARLLGLFRRHATPATFFMPATAAMLYPDALRAIVDGGHEVALAGWIGEQSSGLTQEIERDLLAGARETLERLAGLRIQGFRAPGGQLTPQTLALLVELGLAYDSSLAGDDDPYELTAGGKPTGLIELPTDASRSDLGYFKGTAGLAGEAVFDILRRELEGAYDEGGLFQLTLHPEIIGRRSRLWVVEETLRIARTLPGIWFASHADIAGWCRGKAGG
jgi:peptidoglycan/xylan/chitin deacetylase (PgdA/CDA1 family)